MIIVPEFILKDIDDVYIRENFKRLNLFFQKDSILKGAWKFFDLSFSQSVTDEKVRHGLAFRPLDVIQTSKIGSGDITFHFEKFTSEYLLLSTTGPCAVRLFVGAYREEV